MQVTVYVLVEGGRPFTIEVTPDTTVLQAKEKISEATGIPSHRQTLTLVDKTIDADDRTIASYGVGDADPRIWMSFPLEEQLVALVRMRMKAMARAQLVVEEKLRVKLSLANSFPEIPVDVDADAAVASLIDKLKNLLESLVTLNEAGYRFLHRGREMGTAYTFADHHVAEGDIIEVIERFPKATGFKRLPVSFSR